MVPEAMRLVGGSEGPGFLGSRRLRAPAAHPHLQKKHVRFDTGLRYELVSLSKS